MSEIVYYHCSEHVYNTHLKTSIAELEQYCTALVPKTAFQAIRLINYFSKQDRKFLLITADKENNKITILNISLITQELAQKYSVLL